MYNFNQVYYIPLMDKCEAYMCDRYRDLRSDRFCNLHEEEMSRLRESSDDFDSKIKSIPSKSTDTKCRSEFCNETHNLVEDSVIFGDQIVYYKFCVRHHSQLLKKREIDRLMYKGGAKKCDYNNCGKILGLTNFDNKLFCKSHYNKLLKIKTIPKASCNVDGCKKTSKLIKSYDKLFCKKHFKEQPNPEVFKSTEIIKYKWIESKDKDKDEICKKSHKVDKYSKKVDETSTTKNKVIDIYDLLNKCNNSNKIQICNDKQEICHANECKIYKRLHEKHNGRWCNEHISEITELRNIINKHDGSKEELEARLKELQLRKFPDLHHWKFAYKLWSYYQKHS